VAIGDISAIINTLEWMDADIYHTRAVCIGGDVFMVCTRGPDGLYVVTVTVSPLGVVAAVDSQKYVDFTAGSPGGLIHVDGDVWAIAYLKNDGAGADGSFVLTFTVDSAGNLGGALIDSQLLSGATGNQTFNPSIIKVANAANIFAVAHTDPANDGWVTTITINNDGTIDNVALDTWEFDTTEGIFPGLFHRYDTVYGITYHDSIARGLLFTFYILDDGTLPAIAGVGGRIQTRNIYNELQHRAATVLPIDGDVYAIVWVGDDLDGFVITYSISDAGVITIPHIDVWEYEPTYGGYPHAIIIDPNVARDGKVICAIHATAAGANAIHTFEISNAGIITNAFISEVALDGVDASSYPHIVSRVDPGAPTNTSPADGSGGVALVAPLVSTAYSWPDVRAIFYRCAGSDGFLQTRTIEGNTTPGPTQSAAQWQVTTVSGDYTLPNMVYDSGVDAVNLTTLTVPGGTLAYTTNYYWHVRHRDTDSGNWSDWSIETSFDTVTVPDQPTNVAPSAGAVRQILTPTLESSAYSGDFAHTSSQWQVTTTSGDYSAPVYDSGDDAINLITVTLPSGVLTVLDRGTTYYWHVRHKNLVGWSAWSAETYFSTKAYLERALNAILVNAATIAGAHVYPLVLPPNPTLPAITYTRMFTPRIYSLRGFSGLSYPRFQFTAWAETYAVAVELAEEIRVALDDYMGTIHLVEIQSSVKVNEIAMYEPQTRFYYIPIDFTIWHIE